MRAHAFVKPYSAYYALFTPRSYMRWLHFTTAEWKHQYRFTIRMTRDQDDDAFRDAGMMICRATRRHTRRDAHRYGFDFLICFRGRFS